MNNYDAFAIGTTDYHNNFWNLKMKGKPTPHEMLAKGNLTGEMFVLPYDSNQKYMNALTKECLFRQIGTSVRTADSDLDIWVSDSDDPAEWAPSNSLQTIKDSLQDFTRFNVHCHKLAIITRMDIDFLKDVHFDTERHLIHNFAKRFGKAEEDAFVNGTGIDMPFGILHYTDGAEEGIISTSLTFDNVIALYFTLKPEYRTKGIWLMNDEVAQTLRTLKDKDGNYIWNHATDTIMGRPVRICNAMPSKGRIIAFGDFSYYWIMNRMPISVRTLTESYSLYNQVGYLAHEYLDARLIRQEAVKTFELVDPVK